MGLIIAQILIMALCVIEAIVEKYVILMKSGNNTDYIKNNKLEHRWSAVYFSAVLLCFFILKPSIWPVLLVAPFIRLVFFGNTLNLLRKQGIFYLSDRGIDKLAKDSVGGKGLFIICLVIIAIFNIISWI